MPNTERTNSEQQIGREERTDSTLQGIFDLNTNYSTSYISYDDVMPSAAASTLGRLRSISDLSKKAPKEKSFSNPYMKNIRSEYDSLLEDITEYKLEINPELLKKISVDIESIDKYNEQVKKIFSELTQKETSVSSELEIIKSGIKQKVDELKFKSLIVKFDEYFEAKNWSNVEKCYTNASYIAFTESMFKELEKRSAKMAIMKDELELSHLVELIAKFLGNESSTTLNNIYKKFVMINLTKLTDQHKSSIKDLLNRLSSANKSKALTFIFENKTYRQTTNLNII